MARDTAGFTWAPGAVGHIRTYRRVNQTAPLLFVRPSGNLRPVSATIKASDGSTRS